MNERSESFAFSYYFLGVIFFTQHKTFFAQLLLQYRILGYYLGAGVKEEDEDNDDLLLYRMFDVRGIQYDFDYGTNAYTIITMKGGRSREPL